MIEAILLFAFLWGASYAAHLALYFGQGALLHRINARNPQRRIQADRDGGARARVEIAQFVKSLSVTSGCLAGGMFLQIQGWTFWPARDPGWAGGLAMLVVSILLYDAWFYWGHRLMHTRRLYRHHVWHHRSVAPTVWSNYSDTLADAFAMQSFYLVAPVLLPIPPAVLALHRLLDHVNGQIGHAGFEYFADRSTRFPSPMVCTTFHDQHHAHFRYNYANFFSFWDRLCGTLHPGYDATVEVVGERGSVGTAPGADERGPDGRPAGRG
ncbi:MAG: fatty acid hydroxylase family protein [Deinococcus-Thermus bacterium]|jgi:sterol desaturase/sphingolipid hydroxylase (fatty acid hydroxylase superfamily)|nr:fatty acid hydroxylase family protein [Deinococcota bacterium]